MKALTIAFTGDIAFSRYYKDKCRDEALLDPRIVDFLRASDHCVPNVEGPLSAPNKTGTFIHSNHPDAVIWLKKIGADLWNLANNHMFDADEEGYLSTKRLAGECGAETVGAGTDINEAAKPALYPEAGGVGIFSAGYEGGGCRRAAVGVPGTLNWDEDETIRRTIAEIKKTCRWCVMIVHSGSEFCDLPMPHMRAAYRRFLDWGADVIVGHHPHVMQNYERVGGKIIFYSLGNFIFDTDYQRAQLWSDHGALIKLRFTENEFTFEEMTVFIDRSTGHLSPTATTPVFREIREEEYPALQTLAARAFFEHEKWRKTFLKPDEFSSYKEEDWIRYFEKAAEKQEESGNRRPVYRDVITLMRHPSPDPVDPKFLSLVEYLNKRK